ncbi:DNA-binding transcriptional regulator, LysR family [Bryocella elongata]|uniref:DNA-binding transcriptional regulator, LysR family n=1 Tax=Bryocella elongata TaxID=863522 RepID=A0A1H5VVQ1_9BACT|nr:LysR family transcriptional regulator [Bryocella elongata]SEF91379.1 DNA-binding transcriptional regulator, LysR family [Bryocella elongata]
MDFRIRQLQCFLTLSDLLNYNKTARVLFMSQPAITFQIKSLEEAFGVKLFTRDRQQVRLTDAGVAFREYAQTIMDAVHSAHDCLSNLHTRLRLRVSCGPVGQFVLLPSVLRKLAEEHPDFELEIQDLTTEQQIARLPEGKVDMLLMVGPLPIRDMVFDPIGEDALVAVVSARSHLAQKPVLSIKDLRDEPIIATRLKDCRFHQPWLHSIFAPFGITPRIVDAAQSCTVQMAYAAAGEGVVIAAESMSLCMFPDVVAKPFQETLPGLQLGMASMTGNESRSVSIFRRIVMECASDILRAKPPVVRRPLSVKRPLPYVAAQATQHAS